MKFRLSWISGNKKAMASPPPPPPYLGAKNFPKAGPSTGKSRGIPFPEIPWENPERKTPRKKFAEINFLATFAIPNPG